MGTTYTVQRCTKDHRFYGSVHASDDGYTTRCGIELDEGWYILTTDGGDFTCRKCRKDGSKTNYRRTTLIIDSPKRIGKENYSANSDRALINETDKPN